MAEVNLSPSNVHNRLSPSGDRSPSSSKIPTGAEKPVYVEYPNDISSGQIPEACQLTVTTTKGVFSWRDDGVSLLFKSGSGGIVAAKRTFSDKDLLAVADSHVVVLHDIKKGMQHSYRLKDNHGPVKMLYYDRVAERLFYTTALQHSVQSYSLREGELMDPAPTHPSPPTVFAVSVPFNILISASPNPPTIHVTNLALNRVPLLLQPSCSTSAVVAATFHPERGNVFVLAFADGTLATYDIGRLYDEQGKGKYKIYPGRYGEIAHINKLHTIGTDGTQQQAQTPYPFCGVDPATGVVSVGSECTGITSVGFIPGSECTTASVGSDGKCCIVDFETNGPRSFASIFRQWSVWGPASSLAIVQSRPELLAAHFDGATRDQGRKTAAEGLIIAVGKQDGNVLLYNLEGDLIALRSFGSNDRVVDLDWLEDPEHDSFIRRDAVNVLPHSSTEIGHRATKEAPLKFTIHHAHGRPSTQVVPDTPESRLAEQLDLSIPARFPSAQRHDVHSLRAVSQSANEVIHRLSKSVEKDMSSPLPTVPVNILHKGEVHHSKKDSSDEITVEPVHAVVVSPSQNHSPMIPPDQHETLFCNYSGSSSTTACIQKSNDGYKPVERPFSELVAPVSSKRRTKHRRISRMQPPVIPPRPVPKHGGKLAMRRTEAARLSKDEVKPLNIRKGTDVKDTGAENRQTLEPPTDGAASSSPRRRSDSPPETRHQTIKRDVAFLPLRFAPRPSGVPTMSHVRKRSRPASDPSPHASDGASDIVLDFGDLYPTRRDGITSLPKAKEPDTQPASETQSGVPMRDVMSKNHSSASERRQSEPENSTSASLKSSETVIDWNQGSNSLFEDDPFTKHLAAISPSSKPAQPRQKKLVQIVSTGRPPPAMTTTTDRAIPEQHTAAEKKTAADPAGVAQVQAVFREEFAALLDGIGVRFLEQRTWLQDALAAQHAWASRLEEENSRLRGELARLGQRSRVSPVSR